MKKNKEFALGGDGLFISCHTNRVLRGQLQVHRKR